MIYFLLGTKAQLIKTFPLMHRLRDLGVPYSYIDTVQHGPLCEKLRAVLGVDAPDHFLAPAGTQIERTQDAVLWAFRVLWQAWRARHRIFPRKGMVIIHGDTLSTLLGLIIGKLCGQQICHLEAGERTYRLLRPFPEEIIRRIVDRYADLMLACGETQMSNLIAERRRGCAADLAFNTLLDAVQAVAQKLAVNEDDSGKVLVSIHRFETITSRSRMEFLVSAVEALVRMDKIIWGLHPPTRRKLEEFGLLARLERLGGVELRGLLGYAELCALSAPASFCHRRRPASGGKFSWGHPAAAAVRN